LYSGLPLGARGAFGWIGAQNGSDEIRAKNGPFFAQGIAILLSRAAICMLNRLNLPGIAVWHGICICWVKRGGLACTNGPFFEAADAVATRMETR